MVIKKIDKINLTYIEPNRIIIKNKNNKIKNLTKNNEALNLRVKTLNNTIKEIDNEDICFR